MHAGHFLKQLVQGHAWLREPPAVAGRKVCLLACFSSDGTLPSNSRRLAAMWREHGFQVVLVMACKGGRMPGLAAGLGPGFDGVMVRRNAGYDFGSWAAALRSRPDLRDAALLAMANDSVFGPLDGFGAMLARVDASTADVIGLTDSLEIRHHIQSYLIFYKPGALKHRAFERFWSTRRGNDRDAVIQRSEVPLKSELEQGGLRVEVLYPTVATVPLNPTLLNWRSLLHAGFPFVKVQLFRDPPGHVDIAGWDRVLQQHGFDPRQVRDHLGARYAGSAAEAGASPALAPHRSRSDG